MHATNPPPLNQAPLAYEDATFLDSSEGRPLRILAEYAEPMARFRAQRIEDTVVLFGSARIHSRESATTTLEALLHSTSPKTVIPTEAAGEAEGPAFSAPAANAPALDAARTALDMSRFYEDARSLARLHAAWAHTLPGPRHRFVITSGGGPGIMEAANRGAWEAGAKTIGLNITLPFEQRPNPFITPELSFNFHYFFMRKFWFASLAKALVIFPGGFGTLDEAFEMLTLAQTGKLGKKITVILYGTTFWQSILNLDAMAAHGVIAPRDLDLFHFADTPEAAFAILQRDLLTHHLNPAPAAIPDPPPQRLLGPDIAHTR
jgi:uncharacterized protein (TIGR00730 family)